MLILKGPVRPVRMKAGLGQALELRGRLCSQRIHLRHAG